MLYHFLFLQLLLVCLKSQKEQKKKKLIKKTIKVEIEVYIIIKCSNIFTVYNTKLPYNMTD